LGLRCREFFLREEHKIEIDQLELGAILESTFSRLGFIINFSEFLSKVVEREKSARQNKKGKENEGRKMTGSGLPRRMTLKEERTSPWVGRNVTYHNERFLHAKGDIVREVRVALWVQRGRELVESRCVNHHV
jgi:hypothetical protein